MSRHYERTALILWTQGEEFKQGSYTPDMSMVILKSWAVTTAIFHRASSRPLPPPCLVRCGSANGRVGLADFDWLLSLTGLTLLMRKAASEWRIAHRPVRASSSTNPA